MPWSPYFVQTFGLAWEQMKPGLIEAMERQTAESRRRTLKSMESTFSSLYTQWTHTLRPTSELFPPGSAIASLPDVQVCPLPWILSVPI